MLIGVKDSQSDLEKHYKTFCGLYKSQPSVIPDYSDYYAFQVLFHLTLKGP